MKLRHACHRGWEGQGGPVGCSRVGESGVQVCTPPGGHPSWLGEHCVQAGSARGTKSSVSMRKHLPAGPAAPGCAGRRVMPTCALSSGCMTSTATSCCAGPCWLCCLAGLLPSASAGPSPAWLVMLELLAAGPAAACRRRRQGQVMMQAQLLQAAQKSNKKTRIMPPAVALHAMATASQQWRQVTHSQQAGRQVQWAGQPRLAVAAAADGETMSWRGRRTRPVCVRSVAGHDSSTVTGSTGTAGSSLLCPSLAAC